MPSFVPDRQRTNGHTEWIRGLCQQQSMVLSLLTGCCAVGSWDCHQRDAALDNGLLAPDACRMHTLCLVLCGMAWGCSWCSLVDLFWQAAPSPLCGIPSWLGGSCEVCAVLCCVMYASGAPACMHVVYVLHVYVTKHCKASVHVYMQGSDRMIVFCGRSQLRSGSQRSSHSLGS